MSKILKATHGSDKTPLVLGEIEIPCYVLENGQRVLSQAGIIKSLGMSSTGTDRLGTFLSQERFNTLINNDLTERMSVPIKFSNPNGGPSIIGYEATVLVDICDIIIQARNDKKLLKNQEHIAENAEKLIRAFAKTGIIALIDEITGYQYDRERDTLQKILKAYISEELLPWQQRFPHEFYKQIFRLNKWDYTADNLQKKPGVVGTWTNKYVYNLLPKGVIDELKRKTPKDDQGRRKSHYHRFLTEDTGHPHLDKQLTSIITVMKLSKDWDDFEMKFNQLYGQTSLEFEEEVKEEPLSDFNKALMVAIENKKSK